MDNNVNIDAQTLVNKLVSNNAAELAVKNNQIANLEVTVQTLKSQLEADNQKLAAQDTKDTADKAKED